MKVSYGLHVGGCPNATLLADIKRGGVLRGRRLSSLLLTVTRGDFQGFTHSAHACHPGALIVNGITSIGHILYIRVMTRVNAMVLKLMVQVIGYDHDVVCRCNVMETHKACLVTSVLRRLPHHASSLNSTDSFEPDASGF